MSARDDYPEEAAGPRRWTYMCQHAEMCDEIDRLRSDLAAAAVRSWELNNEIDLWRNRYNHGYSFGIGTP